MPNILDIFGSNAFGAIELTNAINVVPNKYGKLNELGLFSRRGVTTRVVSVEYNNRTLKLLTSKPVGAPGQLQKNSARTLKSFTIPHFPFEDSVLAEEVQGRRAFGSADQMMAVQDLINERLTTMADSHFQTLEWMRLGVLKGTITDGAGSTLLDIYTDFGLTQNSVGFALTTTTTDVNAKCHAVKRYIETELKGESMSRIVCLCSPTFYDALTGHTNVKAAFANWNAAQNLYTDYRTGFTFGGITFIEYNGSVSNSAGAATKMIEDDEAYFVPLGTSAFVTYDAPADFVEAVNTPGLPMYAKQKVMDFERGVVIHTQSNPLPLCLRPMLVVKGTKV